LHQAKAFSQLSRQRFSLSISVAYASVGLKHPITVSKGALASSLAQISPGLRT
jgi:hypothetical protein